MHVETMSETMAHESLIPRANALMGVVFADDRVTKQFLVVRSRRRHNEERSITENDTFREIFVVAITSGEVAHKQRLRKDATGFAT